MSASKESRESGELARVVNGVMLFCGGEPILPSIQKEAEKILGITADKINAAAESWAREREKKLREALRAAEEALDTNGRHADSCILAYCECGEPTKDGGYRQRFRGKWYQIRPKNELPECECEFGKAIAKIREALKGEVI